ncbi:MAG: ATP-binding protein [Sulfolobaceae archaeon]
MNFQNPWWVDRKRIYEDEQVKKVLSLNPRFIIPPVNESLLILGPRQVGKTTYLKTTVMSILEKGIEPIKILFFSCDALKTKEDLISLLSQYRSLVNNEGGYVFLDEITFVEDWNIGLLHLFNAGYFRNTTVYVSGSASVSLKKETLPGRPLKKVVFYPLNFRLFFNIFYKKLNVPSVSFLNVKEFFNNTTKLIPYLADLNRALLEYLKRGGFFATNYIEGDPLNSLYEVYKDAILSDIAKLGRDERFFREIVEKVIDFYGTRISENSIAKETRIGSHNTVSSYLSLAEDLFILRIFYKIENGRFNFRSFKKVYFTDPFIYRVMKRYTKGEGNIEENEIPRVIEGVVGEHLAREFNNVGYTFFKGGREVDFIYENLGVKVKWGRGSFRDLKTEKGYILSLDDFNIDGEKAIIPVSIFLYLISSEKVFY